MFLFSSPVLHSAIASEAPWYNKNIKTDNESTYSFTISKKCVNCVGHLFNEKLKLKASAELKQEYSFYEIKMFFIYAVITCNSEIMET